MSLISPAERFGAGNGDQAISADRSAVPAPSTQKEDGSQAAAAMRLCVLLGRILFDFGATTQRVQDSLGVLARSLGCKVEMLVSYDALLLTIHDGAIFQTRIDASRGIVGLNLRGLTRVSELLRSLPGSAVRPEALEQALCAIRDAPPVHPVPIQALAAGCAGVGFCIVNGGDPVSWLCCFLVAAFIFFIRRPLAARNFNIHLTLFAIALGAGFLAGWLARLSKTTTPAIALVAPVLFLVPGVPLINGGIDVVRNHVTVGMARIAFALVAVAALCLGAGLSVPLLPVQINAPYSLPGAWEIVGVATAGALAGGALACLNNGGLPAMALCGLGGLTGRLVRALLTMSGWDLVTASLIGVLCSTLIVGSVAERLRWPAVVASVMAALPMVPGYFVIVGLHSLFSFAASNTADPAQLAVGIQALARAVFISAALVVGVIGPVVVLQRSKARV